MTLTTSDADLLTALQIAKLVGVAPEKIEQLARSGHIPSTPAGPRRFRFHRDDLETIREAFRTKPCPECHAIAKLLYNWGDTPPSQIIDALGLDQAVVSSHLDDLASSGLIVHEIDGRWRLTANGTRFADGVPIAAPTPVSAESPVLDLRQNKYFLEYVALLAYLVDHGPVSARSLAVAAKINVNQSVRRVRHLERCRYVFRPTPRSVAITPQGQEWLSVNSPAQEPVPS